MSKSFESHIAPSPEDLSSQFLSRLVYDELAHQAGNHSGKKAAFVALDFQPRLDESDSLGHPGQLLNDIFIAADATPGIEPFIEGAAEEFTPGFSKIVQQFYQEKDLLTDIRDKLDKKENVTVITNHGEIYDIALILAALRVALARDAADQHVDVMSGDQFNIIVHRMISQLGVADKYDTEKVAPALGVLRLVGNIFESFPRTETARKARLPAELTKTCNDLMINTLDNQLAKGGQILAFAPSGSKDESIFHLGSRRKVIKPVNSGTHRIMQAENSWILAVGVALDNSEGPKCSISELSKCNTQEQCHELLDSIAHRHALLTGVKTLYARTQAQLDEWRSEATTHEHNQTNYEMDTYPINPRTLNLALVAGGMVVGAGLIYLLEKRKRR